VKRNYTFIVLGLGGFGAGAAYWLARRAEGEVLGLEQFEIGHTRGSSQDHSRIIRLSYHTPAYVKLAGQAYQAWAALEAEAGEKLILKTGGLDFAPRASAIDMSPYSESMAACRVPFEELDASEIMRRWPQFRLTDDIHGLYQSESGIAPAAKCNATHLRLARAHGATLVERSPVTAIRDLGNEMEVAAGGMVYRCSKLVITAGAWSNHALAHFGLKLPLTITQEQVTYFASPRPADFSPERFPIWIWLDVPCFYGFPAYGEPGPKAAEDVGGEDATPETRTYEANPAALDRVKDFLSRYIPGALGPEIYTRTCLYTIPPDRDFVIDALPGHPNCVIAVDAAHGFKFASLIGKILSELAVDGRSESDLQRFHFDRPILHVEKPPKHFMF